MPSFADFTQAELEQGPNLQILLDAKRSLVDLNPLNFGMLVETGDYAGFKIEVTGSGFVYHEGEPLLGEFSKIEVVRRQSFWNQWRPNLRESLAHLVCLIMRRVVCDASVAFRASFVRSFPLPGRVMRSMIPRGALF